MEYYRQCTLQHKNTQTVAWISEKGAKVGFRVTLEEDPNLWWTVVQAGTTRLPKDEALDRERDYLHQRRASDIKSGSHERF